MSKYIDTAQIRAEIDRRYEENRERARYDDYYRGMNDGLDHLEQFLDTHQEQPNEIDVNKKWDELQRYFREINEAFEEGRKSTAKKPEQPVEGLEEAANKAELSTFPMPKDGDIDKVNDVMEARTFFDMGFKAGAKWDRAKMLEEAVEGLPKWKKSPGALRYGILEDEHGRYIQHDGYKLYFDDLLKLPKED